MKMPSLIKRKKLHAATAARRSHVPGLPEEMDYEQMSEPNMKLSRALLIVLLLHIVAVAGIIAFNTIKTREGNSATASEPDNAPAAVAPETAPAAIANEAAANSAPNESTKVAAKPETKPLVRQTEPVPKVESKTAPVPDSGKVYTVVRGDNPVSIARRFHVNYDALLALNQITDPRKLQIGAKLHIPEREVAASKHKSE